MEEIPRRFAVFRIDGQRYALPVDAVVRVLPLVAVSPLPEAPAIALGTMVWLTHSPFT